MTQRYEDDFDALADLFDIDRKPPEIEAKEVIADEYADKPKQPRTRGYKRREKFTYRRAFSETQLLDIVIKDFPFQDGDSYNFITGGDVDGLSYLKIVLRQQDIDHLLFSTWCMALEDVYQIEEWIMQGKLKKVDAYVGEIFPRSYSNEYRILKKVIQKSGGRVCVFRNHSKIFAGTGPLFAFGIQSSANINTNPRTENGCIQIGKEPYEFYKAYFEGIKSFE